ncbi:TetR/AcrR family transcriptional regulator [Streptomyces rubiginosohelvolus]|uniref:TetR/AcrR family transcriptional regulator n=1 Tax=Streptomyces rubiginosohelvolus TaxID=67362 RepID=A0ABW6EWF3_9ACTN
MTPVKTDRGRSSKQRMLESTIALLQEHGAGAVTVDAVLEHSQAPRGSVYHHFPGGRNALLLAAVRQAGEEMSAPIEDLCRTGPPEEALRQAASLWRHRLASSEFGSGCAIVAAVIDNRNNLPEADEAVRETFARWQTAFADLLVRSDYDEQRARRLSSLVVAAIEGAVILCRAQRSTQPLDDVVDELLPLLRPS